MPKEIDPSSYRCDCGYQTDHFENTIRELKQMSMRRPQRLRSDDDKHTVVFSGGEMSAMWCPHVGKDIPVNKRSQHVAPPSGSANGEGHRRPMEKLGSFAYSEEQRKRWRAGELADEWFRAYPELFDEDDLRITRNQRDYHFFEWLAAIHIYHSIGWLSLVEKYRCTNHPRKLALYGKFFPDEWQDRLKDFAPQMPDLLVYRKDRSDFLLCEVKGRTDKLKPKQIEFFNAIAVVTGRPVYTVEYWELTTGC